MQSRWCQRALAYPYNGQFHHAQGKFTMLPSTAPAHECMQMGESCELQCERLYNSENARSAHTINKLPPVQPKCACDPAGVVVILSPS